jgi:hypothetical protein
MRFYAQNRFFMYLLPGIWGLMMMDYLIRAVRHPSFEHDITAICYVIMFGLQVVSNWFNYWELTPEGLIQRNIKGVTFIPYSNIVNVAGYVRANGKVAEGCIRVDAPFGQQALVKPAEYRQFAEALEKRVDPAVMHI